MGCTRLECVVVPVVCMDVQAEQNRAITLGLPAAGTGVHGGAFGITIVVAVAMAAVARPCANAPPVPNNHSGAVERFKCFAAHMQLRQEVVNRFQKEEAMGIHNLGTDLQAPVVLRLGTPLIRVMWLAGGILIGGFLFIAQLSVPVIIILLSVISGLVGNWSS